MDDPIDIAAAFAATADKVVDQARDEAVSAFNKINDPAPYAPKYSAEVALKTMTALAKIARDELKHVALTAGDLVVFSSRTIPGNEKAILDIMNGLIDQGIKVLTDGEKLLVLELFTLRETAEGLELRLRHFDGALTPMEKEEALVLRLISLTENEALFENPVHSRPKTSRITRTGPRSFVGRSEIIGGDGKVSVIEATWQRLSQ